MSTISDEDLQHLKNLNTQYEEHFEKFLEISAKLSIIKAKIESFTVEHIVKNADNRIVAGKELMEALSMLKSKPTKVENV